VPLIWGKDQTRRLRHINTTGKSADGRFCRLPSEIFLRAGLDRETGGDLPGLGQISGARRSHRRAHSSRRTEPVEMKIGSEEAGD
jgi:hypothetical protein